MWAEREKRVCLFTRERLFYFKQSSKHSSKYFNLLSSGSILSFLITHVAGEHLRDVTILIVCVIGAWVYWVMFYFEDVNKNETE